MVYDCACAGRTLDACERALNHSCRPRPQHQAPDKVVTFSFHCFLRGKNYVQTTENEVRIVGIAPLLAVFFFAETFRSFVA